MILPSARLSTLTLVRISSCHKARKQTSARERHAHCAVYKYFNIHILGYVVPDTLYILYIDLSGKHYSLCTHLLQIVCGNIVYNDRLSGNVYFKVRHCALYKCDTADIAYNSGVYSAVVCCLYKSGKQFYLIV